MLRACLFQNVLPAYWAQTQKPEISELQSRPPIPHRVLIERGYIKTKAAQSGASSSNMAGVTSTLLKDLTGAVIELKEQVQSLKTGQELPSDQRVEMILKGQ